MVQCQVSKKSIKGLKCICVRTADERDIRSNSNFKIIINLEDTFITYMNNKIIKMSVG